MNQNRLIFVAAGVVVVLIIGTVLILEWFGPKPTMTLELRGPAGSQVVGSVTLGGKEQAVTATLPAKLSFETDELSFALAPSLGDHPIDAQVTIGGEFIVSVKSHGVRGSVYRPTLLGRWRGRAFATSLMKGEIIEIRKGMRPQD
jgi:hypothetical protein